MRVQTADENITIIHTTPVHQLMSCEAKSCVFVRNKFIKMFLTSNLWFLSIILLSPLKKVISSESGEKYAQIKHCLQVKTVQKTVLKKYVGEFWCERQQDMDLFTEESVIMENGLIFHISYLIFKNVLMMDMFLTNTQLLASQDINWWTGVEWITCGLLWYFYQLFGLSFWRHPFTAEDPLVSKWCNATFNHKYIYIYTFYLKNYNWTLFAWLNMQHCES